MPDQDFTLVTVDSRLWRSTPEKRLWRDNQWADNTDVFDRHSPLRTILGEEQFAWLQQIIQTDSSQVICVSGINVLNTIYNQLLGPPPHGEEDFRVFENNCFDFAGWRSVPTKPCSSYSAAGKASWPSMEICITPASAVMSTTM